MVFRLQRARGGQEETAKGVLPKTVGCCWDCLIDKDQGHIVVAKEESGGDSARCLRVWEWVGRGLQDERGRERRQEGIVDTSLKE